MELRSGDGRAVEYLKMAVGWDPARRSAFGSRSKDIDLNAAALLYADRSLVEVVYHEQLSSRDGAVRHHGDSTTGQGKGDNEVVTVDLTRLAPHVTAIALLVSCYTGQSFDRIGNGFCRLLDGTTDRELSRYDLGEAGPVSGFLMGVLHRGDRVWRYRSIEQGMAAGHPVEAVSAIAPHLYRYEI
ncbi:TerD family protein [Nocardia sp. NPDC050710]|uniref:TerD family protein n=1 Tax=Nocardia sp. NPDC050710 TaxID=3157220 RepID=UPI003409E5C6